MVLYITIDVYTAIITNCLSVACVAQWVEHVIIAVIFKAATFIIVTIVKSFVFIFIKFSPFCYIVSPFNLI